MTVAELLKALETLPGDMSVLINNSEESPLFLEPVSSARVETVITKQSPYSPWEEVWFWKPSRNSIEPRVGGSKVAAFVIW